jgi:hypothetical protein
MSWLERTGSVGLAVYFPFVLGLTLGGIPIDKGAVDPSEWRSWASLVWDDRSTIGGRIGEGAPSTDRQPPHPCSLGVRPSCCVAAVPSTLPNAVGRIRIGVGHRVQSARYFAHGGSAISRFRCGRPDAQYRRGHHRMAHLAGFCGLDSAPRRVAARWCIRLRRGTRFLIGITYITQALGE